MAENTEMKDWQRLLQKPDYVFKDDEDVAETDEKIEDDASDEGDAEGTDEETAAEVGDVSAANEQAVPDDTGQKPDPELAFYKNQVGELRALIDKLIDRDTKSEAETVEKTKPPEYDFKKAEKTYAKLILEGEEDKAVDLREEIDKNRLMQFEHKFEQFKLDSEKKFAEGNKSAPGRVRFEMKVEEVETKYPALRRGSKEYDEDLVSAVNGLVDSRVSKGMDPGEALDLAVKKFIGSTGEKPKLGETRTNDAKNKAAAAQKQQPPMVDRSIKSRVGKTEIRSFDDYMKLTRAESELLRGIKR